ncbi:MAG: ABC-F family ATP-binding cassette domain-containing protein, partial [Bacteroidetes bacterium]|nr:ABC-F family ATP-binding cassette domain-containing protein [Bacteroidota bacterium]
MHYVSVENLSKSFGIRPLFQGISFHISEGDKIALVAKNGSGKSTLLRILSGNETADEGSVWMHKDVNVALFEQDPQFQEDLSVLENIFHYEHPVISAIKEYEQAAATGNANALGELIPRMDELNAWDFDAKVKQILGKLQIHQLDQPMKTLSGGQRKRVALAQTLIDIGFEHRHVLLIMDEPTNHLDIGMVEWLEHYLNQEKV